jgi:hypothetical protein
MLETRVVGWIQSWSTWLKCCLGKQSELGKYGEQTWYGPMSPVPGTDWHWHWLHDRVWLYSQKGLLLLCGIRVIFLHVPMKSPSFLWDNPQIWALLRLLICSLKGRSAWKMWHSPTHGIIVPKLLLEIFFPPKFSGKLSSLSSLSSYLLLRSCSQ